MPGLNQHLFGAALLAACGRGMMTPVLAVDEGSGAGSIEDFLNVRTETIRCDEIPAAVRGIALDDAQRGARYLIGSIAAMWKIWGPSWSAVDVLLGVWFAISGAMAFLVSRLLMTRAWSVAVAALFVLSPLQMGNLVDIRDYAKAPFSLIAWWFVLGLVLVRPRSARGLWLRSAAAGTIVGVGFGMRTDIAINLVLLLAALLVFLPEPITQSWRPRAIAAAVCLAAFFMTATPLLIGGNNVGLTWHWALLGQARQFDDELRVTRTPYELGYAYSDSVVATAINGYASRTNSATAPIVLGTAQYERTSRALYLETVRAFPADVGLRMAAATVRVLELPFSAMRPYSSNYFPRWLNSILEWRNRTLAVLDGWGVVLFAAVLLATFASSPKKGIFLLFAVAILGGYPSIQFQQRHYFHLELLSLCLLGVVVSQAWSIGARLLSGGPAAPSQAPAFDVRALARPAAILLVVVGGLAGVAVGLRTFQQRAVSSLFERYVAAPVVPIERQWEVADGGTMRLARRDPLLPAPGARTIASQMLVVTLAGDPCGFRRVALTFQYGPKARAEEFSRTLGVELPPGSQPTKVFVPVFETGTTVGEAGRLAFAGVDVPLSEVPCVLGVARFERPDAYPLLITAVVRPDFRREVLYQRLRGWEVRSDR